MFDFSLHPGENQWQYKWRVYQAKAHGLIDMDWEDLSAKIDKTLRPEEPPFNECVYRKEAATVGKFYEHVFAESKSQDESDLLYQAKSLLADQRREYNKLLRADARADHLGERMLQAVSEMNQAYPLLSAEPPVNMAFGTSEGVLFIADVHYGMTTDNVWNQYNTQICVDRLRRLVRKAASICSFHGLRKLHIVLLGDMVAGAIHVGARVASEELVIDQLMHVSELLAQVICELSLAVAEVVVHSTYGNHARVVANKKESIHADNMERIIPWWLRERLSGNPRITVAESPYHEFIKINLFGKNVAAVHGDLDSVKDFGALVHGLFSRAYGEQIDYAVMADKHHKESFERLGVESYIVGSLCGTDDHANSRRLYSKPSQALMLFNEAGLECHYPIDVTCDLK